MIVTVNSTDPSANLLDVAEQPIGELPLGLDGNTNPRTLTYTAIVDLIAG
jgi:hypothetical protein